MLSWTVKTETAENTNQGPKWLLSEIKDVAISNTAVKWAWQSLLIMNVCNNATAIATTFGDSKRDSRAENSTGLNNQPILCWLRY